MSPGGGPRSPSDSIRPQLAVNTSSEQSLGGEPELNAVTCYVLAVVFLATVVRSAFGFGEALVAVPHLVMRIPAAVAVPLAVLLSITVAGFIVAQDWRQVYARSAAWLVGATLLGIPLGIWLLTHGNERLIKATLAGVLIAFSGYSLLARTPPHLTRDRPAWLVGFGFLAGVLGGAYGMNGPPLVIYGSLRRWSAQHFRATLQAYFLPASLVGVGWYWADGLLGRAVFRYYLLCLPGAVVAILLGRAINRRLRGRTFLIYIHLGLIGIGIVLLLQTAR
jgi:uncharacterized protein